MFKGHIQEIWAGGRSQFCSGALTKYPTEEKGHSGSVPGWKRPGSTSELTWELPTRLIHRKVWSDVESSFQQPHVVLEKRHRHLHVYVTDSIRYISGKNGKTSMTFSFSFGALAECKPALKVHTSTYCISVQLPGIRWYRSQKNKQKKRWYRSQKQHNTR